MQIATVEALFRYPVKSMGGERLDRLDIGPDGIPGDRAWALRDESRGGIRCGKRFPELMACAARYAGEPSPVGPTPALVTLPEGNELPVNAPDLPALLSDLVGSPLSIWPLLPMNVMRRFHAGKPTDDDAVLLHAAFGDSEPDPDLATFARFLGELRALSRGYFDAYPILIMTKESLLHLGRAAPARNLALSRFRPNVLLRTATRPSRFRPIARAAS